MLSQIIIDQGLKQEHPSWSEPVGNLHLGVQRAPSVPPYHLQKAHQGRFLGPSSALAASSWWSSEISRVRASSWWSFSVSCCRRISTSTLSSWWFSCGSWSSSSSTIHTWPCGLGACLADSSPLRMRRLIVSAETLRRVAASVIVISMVTSLPCCLSGTCVAAMRVPGCLRVALMVAGGWWRPAFSRRQVRRLSTGWGPLTN